VNDVGKPGAGEPHARWTALGLVEAPALGNLTWLLRYSRSAWARATGFPIISGIEHTFRYRAPRLVPFWG
jgi:hypothetical protein